MYDISTGLDWLNERRMERLRLMEAIMGRVEADKKDSVKKELGNRGHSTGSLLSKLQELGVDITPDEARTVCCSLLRAA